jgi:hypothetical protein
MLRFPGNNLAAAFDAKPLDKCSGSSAPVKPESGDAEATPMGPGRTPRARELSLRGVLCADGVVGEHR